MKTETDEDRNGCKLTTKAFSFRKAWRAGWGGGDYGQLRYTHSVSPYRSIATGGSHFLANGCFHRSRQRSVFPFNSIISPLPSVSSLFSSVPSLSPSPTFPPLFSHVKFCLYPHNEPLEFRVSRFLKLEEKKKRDSREILFGETCMNVFLASDGRKGDEEV